MGKCLVAELGADVDKASKEGKTPLHISAFFGILGVVQCLVTELKADVNLGDEKGLRFAAEKGHVAIVRYMVKELGANVDQASKEGITPLYMAAQKGTLDLVQCLVKEHETSISARPCTMQLQ
jgi:ankyrin repeat/protein kinase domain-containing protein 1